MRNEVKKAKREKVTNFWLVGIESDEQRNSVLTAYLVGLGTKVG